MNQVVDPSHVERAVTLELRRESTGEWLPVGRIITLPRIKAERNTAAYQPPETEVQQASGDARVLIGERIIDVLIEGPDEPATRARLALISLDLMGASHLRADTYSLPLAGSRGLAMVQQLGLDGRSFRASVAYYPSQQLCAGPDGIPAFMGPL